MNRTFLAAIAIALFFASCTEIGPAVILTPSTAKDTTYLASVETPQSHNVLVEEFTGATCPNCPSGHNTLISLSATNPGRINSLALHVNDFIQAKPVPGATYDFRTVDATNIEQQVFGGIPGEPSAGIDRLPVGGALLPFVASWSGAINSRLTAPNPINLYVKSTYNSASRATAIEAKIAYTQADSMDEYLSLAIVEDSLYDKQDSSTFTIDHYLFNNILRKLITPVTGTKILPTYAAKEPGRVAVIYYNDTLDASWDYKHCRVIAFIARNGANMEVLQSAQAKIAP